MPVIPDRPFHIFEATKPAYDVPEQDEVPQSPAPEMFFKALSGIEGNSVRNVL